MTLTERDLNRATLARQLLLGRADLEPGEGVRRIVALQAQEGPSPYLALWNRLARFDPADLDSQLADHTIVKASLMRITLHIVHGEDYGPFHRSMVASLRASRLFDRRFTTSGLSIDDVDALLPPLLEFAGVARSTAEIEAMIATRVGRPTPRAWWALRTFAPLWHAPTGGPWSFGTKSAFVAARQAGPHDGEPAALGHLVRRYLSGFGPASVQDIAQFSMLRRPLIRDAIEALGAGLVRMPGPDGSLMFDVPDGILPSGDVPAPPRLLPMWDSTLLAYAKRDRIIPPDYRPLVIRQNGDVLPTLLIDGYVAGVWRQVGEGIEATAFHALGDDAWRALETEAEGLVDFLADRGSAVYRRYGHWWSTLPSAEVRRLAG